ncbi:T9SS type A sorting domain-containing protein [Owenweeksia hongkongensis]|uniref:T9SS type A sorting domain-containing protein n=1 Tax=Owenweeksia hongkongensis TaxID=253245 RepID=UPI003A95CA5B
MKKLLSLSIFTAYSVVGMAQLPVSTSAENKNAVLEEFTGIYCQFCPDGHKKANDFATANPGDVVLINIHTGGYAAPGAGDPDFRTPYGAAIAGQSNLAGYPAGTMNRREFTGMQQNGSGTAMSRGDWATAGTTVIGESSYANIAIEGDIDYAANTLTIDVETYFTGAAPGSTVKLNVAVLQSNIPGPQTGMAANPTQVVNGVYYHDHMLRDLLTGQWGIDIPTTQNVVNSYSYTWPIPADINGVPVSMGDLEIAAFISETQQVIVTGATGPVNFTLPAGVSTADLEAVSTMSNNGGYCQTSITPEFTIQNNESFAVDSAEAILVMNGGAPISQWVTNIPANGTKLVTFPSQNLVAGANTFSFSTSVTGVYKYIDVTAANNNASADDIYMVSSTVNNYPMANDFESSTVFGPPANMILEDMTGRIYIVDKNVTNPPLTTPIGGYAQSENSLRFDFATIDPGVTSSIVSEKVSLANANGSEVQFDYAYGIRGTSTGDMLEAFVSVDCGQNWIRIWDATAGSGLETAPATASGSRFYPTSASDWKTISAYISGIDGAAEVMIKIKGTSALGNALYFDNLMIDGKPIGLAEINAAETASVYPNPATDKFFVELNEPTDFNVQLSTTTGQVVRVADFTKTTKAEINTNGLAKGVYILNISSDNGTSSQRVTIAD